MEHPTIHFHASTDETYVAVAAVADRGKNSNPGGLPDGHCNFAIGPLPSNPRAARVSVNRHRRRNRMG